MKRIIFLSFLSFLVLCQKERAIGEDETWLGFYLNGKKAGYSYQKCQPAKDHFRFYNRMKMRMRIGESLQELLATTDCLTNKDLSIRSLRFELISQKQRFKLQGFVKENNLFIETYTDGTESPKGVRRIKLPAEEKIYPSFIIPRIAQQKKFQKDKEYTLPIFDATMAQIIPAKVRIIGEENLRIEDSNYQCLKAQVTLLNNLSTYWMTQEGRVVKEEMPPKILAIKESPQKALAEEKGEETIDILSYFCIKVDTAIPNPKGLEYVKVEISGISPLDYDLSVADQKVVSEKPLVLVMNVPKLEAKGISLPKKEMREFLKPSLYIQSDDKMIIQKAKEIKGEETEGVEVVKRILFWVYENLKKVPTASLPSAVDVLKNMEGDCNEHSILFAALCRAAGIPAQICVGVVYSGGSFFYHAWNLIYLGRWVACDPTFGEFPANPTHIILKVGEIEEQAKVLGAVGNIKIKVLEFN